MRGVPISKRLVIAGFFFLGVLVLIAIAGPRIHFFEHDSVANVTPTKLSAPQEQPVLQPYHKPTLALLPTQQASKPNTKPVCQPCIQAAQEVLDRYLAAIRTGAGIDEEQELNNVFEAPRIYPANSPMYGGPVFDSNQLHAQRQRQLYAARSLPSQIGPAR